ncbi:hypothetical protein ACHWQZ_G005772 [Mnemiopsis leidyi]
MWPPNKDSLCLCSRGELCGRDEIDAIGGPTSIYRLQKIALLSRTAAADDSTILIQQAHQTQLLQVHR